MGEGDRVAPSSTAARPTVPAFLLVAFLIVAAGAVGWVLWRGSAAPSDFAQDYFAAKVLADGGSIYSDDVAARGAAHFGRRSPANFHPPTLVLLTRPLGTLPYGAAFVVLGLLTVGLYVGSLAALTKALLPGEPVRRALLLGFLWYPFWACLTHGQFSGVVAAALVGSWLADQARRPVLAGVLVGLATLLKLFPALVVLYFLRRRDWRALAGALLMIAVGWLGAAMVVGSQDVARYWTEIAPEAAARWSAHPLNLSLHGWPRAALGDTAWDVAPLVRHPELGRWVGWVSAAVVLAVTVVRGLRWDGPRLFAGLCAASLLLSPLTWSHTVAVALLPLLVDYAGAPIEKRNGRLVVLGLLLVGFPGPPLGQWVRPLFDGSVPWAVAAVFQAPLIGLLVLWWRLVVSSAPSATTPLRRAARAR